MRAGSWALAHTGQQGACPCFPQPSRGCHFLVPFPGASDVRAVPVRKGRGSGRSRQARGSFWSWPRGGEQARPTAATAHKDPGPGRLRRHREEGSLARDRHSRANTPRMPRSGRGPAPSQLPQAGPSHPPCQGPPALSKHGSPPVSAADAVGGAPSPARPALTRRGGTPTREGRP